MKTVVALWVSDHAIAHVVGCQLSTAVAWVRSKVRCRVGFVVQQVLSRYISFPCHCLFTNCSTFIAIIQGIHKRMVQFQKLITLYFSPYTSTTDTVSSRNCLSFSCATAVHFSCLLRGRWTSFQDGVAAGEGLLCVIFWGVQICDYNAAWVSCTV
jgi:hypothetical protein